MLRYIESSPCMSIGMRESWRRQSSSVSADGRHNTSMREVVVATVILVTSKIPCIFSCSSRLNFK